MNLQQAEAICTDAGAQLDRGRKRVLHYGPALRHPGWVQLQNGSVAAMRWLLIDGGYKSNHPDAEKMYREMKFPDIPVNEMPQRATDLLDRGTVDQITGEIDRLQIVKLQAIATQLMGFYGIDALAIAAMSFDEIDAMYNAMRIIERKPVKIKIDNSLSNQKLADYFVQITTEITRRMMAGEILPGELTGIRNRPAGNSGDSAGNSPATGSGTGEGPQG